MIITQINPKMPLLLTFIGILTLVLLIAYLKLDTFISFVLVALSLGLASGMGIEAVGISIQSGIGKTLGDLVLIIGFGAMLGKLVAESGAAQRITNALIALFGQKYLVWGLALAGFVVGIPLFYNAGFIIVVPLIFSVAATARLPILYVAIPMLSALSVAHGYLPPHPSPAAIAKQLNADLTKTLLYGIAVAIPAIAIAGPLFAKTLKKYNPTPNPDFFKPRNLTNAQMPTLAVSLFTALLPVFLLTVVVNLKPFFGTKTVAFSIISLLSEPYFGMLLSVLVAIYWLGIRRGVSMKATMKHLEDAIKSASPILLVIAGAGALKQILNDSGTSVYLGQQLTGIGLNPLILGWAIAGVIRVCVGSATVAGLTAVGIVAPLVQQHLEISPELMTLSIGAGSLMLSHLNDNGFWLFKEYFNLSIVDCLKTWTVMETIVSVVGLLGVLLIDALM